LDILAFAIVTGNAFFTADGDEIGDTFGLILSVAVPDWEDDYIASIGGACAPVSTMTPSGLFTEMHPIHQGDVPRLVARIQAMTRGKNEEQQSRPKGPRADGDDPRAAP
jgi:hypothetical protein